MTRRITMVVIGAALLSACDDANPNDDRLHAALVARIPQADFHASNECECFYDDYGYASYGACLDGELTGSLPPSIDACVRAASVGRGQFADIAECQLRAMTSLSACLGNAECTDPAFDACYAASTDAENACTAYSPCYTLTGAALADCQTEASLLFSEIGNCFN